MENDKQHIITVVGRAILIVSFLFLITCLSENLSQEMNRSKSISSVTEFHSNPPKALISNAFEIPAIHTITAEGHLQIALKISKEDHKIAQDNRIIHQQLAVFKRICLAIKPDEYFRYYYHNFSNNSDIPLILS